MAADTVAGRTRTLQSAILIAAVGSTVNTLSKEMVVQASVSGTGALTASISIYGNTANSNSGGVLLGTISLSGTTLATDGFSICAPWPYIYSDTTALTGTGASVTVLLGQ